MSETQISNTSQPLTIYVWPSEWGLASLDAECLTALVIYFKITLSNKKISMIEGFAKIHWHRTRC